jgi:hypothetical protein
MRTCSLHTVCTFTASLLALLVCSLLGFTACLLACLQSMPARPPLLGCSPGLALRACLLVLLQDFTACQEASLLACFASRKEASRPGAQDQEGAPVAPRARGGAPASVRETARGEWASGGCRLELEGDVDA